MFHKKFLAVTNYNVEGGKTDLFMEEVPAEGLAMWDNKEVKQKFVNKILKTLNDDPAYGPTATVTVFEVLSAETIPLKNTAASATERPNYVVDSSNQETIQPLVMPQMGPLGNMIAVGVTGLLGYAAWKNYVDK